MIVSDAMNKELEGLSPRGVLDGFAVLTIDFLGTRHGSEFDWLSQKGKRCIQIQQVGRRTSSDLVLSRSRHRKCDVSAVGGNVPSGNVSMGDISMPFRRRNCWYR